MPLPTSNFNAILGAGVFGIVCAATLYVVEHYRQERRRHGMAKDLARLDTELACVRQELDNLIVTMNKQSTSTKASTSSTKKLRKHKAASVISAASEDYTSALDSSDLEFYDVSDDDDAAETVVNTSLDETLAEIDEKLDGGEVEEVELVLERLHVLCIEHPESPHLLWRIGKAHYKLFERSEGKESKLENLEKGLEACNSAVKLTPELAEVHKWIAILIGSRNDYQPMKEKIQDGYVLKKHVDAAVKLNPSDPPLHHMLGRFCYGVSELKWYERKIAATLFADPPSSSFEEALKHFLQAEKLSQNAWKDNKLYIAKCYFQLGNLTEGVKYLHEASRISGDSQADEKVDNEIEELLKKHGSSR